MRRITAVLALVLCSSLAFAKTTSTAPPGATVLFDGTDFSQWVNCHGQKDIAWKIVGGAMEIVPTTTHKCPRIQGIKTAGLFNDFQLHVEFNLPEGENTNSGIYIQRRYEIQIINTSGGAGGGKYHCGEIYKQKSPDRDMCSKPGVWQSYDVMFRSPRFETGADGKVTKVENARITVIHNGVAIHNNVIVKSKTGVGFPEGPEPGPIMLQDHGAKLRFRNIWIIPTDAPAAKAPAVAAVDKVMADYVAKHEASGAVTLVMQGGKVVHLGAVGSADVAGKKAMTTDAIFRIASMTKPITATAMLMLQDEGKLSVSDPVSKYIPEFKDAAMKTGKLKRPLTIRDLMTHTSGVSVARGLKGAGGVEATLAEIAVAAAKAPLGFEPGSKWQYSGGLTVCGRIIEVVSGKAYDAFVRDRIFKPLDMTDTAFVLTKAQAPRLPVMIEPGPERKSVVASKRFIEADPTERHTPGPSGGLFSTASDLGRFYQMILNGGELGGVRIVSAAAVRQMTTLQTGELVTGFTPGNGWGLGWCIVGEPQGVTGMLSRGTYGHGGAFGTQGWVDPKRGMVFVLMIQRVRYGNSDGSAMRGAFQQAAVNALTPRKPTH